MTLEERIAELKFFHEGNGRFLMVPFDVLHARVETLMGRPVWTHEFANSDLKEAKQEAESLRKALAVQEAATKRERARRENAEHSLRATKGHVTRLRKRAQAGLCPVCNRHFEALERHMHSKHPDCEEVAV